MLVFCQSFVIKNMTNKKHGGKREGAGRPPKEPTATISFRVKKKNLETIKPKVKALIKRLDKG